MMKKPFGSMYLQPIMSAIEPFGFYEVIKKRRQHPGNIYRHLFRCGDEYVSTTHTFSIDPVIEILINDGNRQYALRTTSDSHVLRLRRRTNGQMSYHRVPSKHTHLGGNYGTWGLDVYQVPNFLRRFIWCIISYDRVYDVITNDQSSMSNYRNTVIRRIQTRLNVFNDSITGCYDVYSLLANRNTWPAMKEEFYKSNSKL